MFNSTHSPGTPRRPVLVGLSIAVLAAHLWLLAGPLPLSQPPLSADSADTPRPGHVDSKPPSGATTPPPAQGSRPQALLPTVNVSTVRWISPTLAASTPIVERPRARKNTKPARASTPASAPSSAQRHAANSPSTRPVETPPAHEQPATDISAQALATTPNSPAAAPHTTTAGTSDTAPATPQTGALAPPTTAQPPDDPSAASPATAAVVATAPTTAYAPSTASRQPRIALAPSIELYYNIQGQAKGMRYTANAHLRWQVTHSRYEAEMAISAFLLGSRVQTSRGHIGNAGLEPERFGDRRRNNEKAAHFDRDAQLIRFSNNAPDAPLQTDAQDRLSVLLQLGGLLNAQPQAYPDGTRLNLQVAGAGGAETYAFMVGPLQKLTVSTGAVNARLLTREPRHEYDNRIEIWLAPQLQHLPVRIRVTEADGSHADQLLRDLPPLHTQATNTP